MRKMSNKKPLNNGVKEGGTEGEGFPTHRYSVGNQRGPDRHPGIAHRTWSKEDSKVAILC